MIFSGEVYNGKAIIHQVLRVRFNYSCSKWNLIKVFFSGAKLDGGKFMRNAVEFSWEIIKMLLIAEN
jgi:hypothetical protein